MGAEPAHRDVTPFSTHPSLQRQPLACCNTLAGAGLGPCGACRGLNMSREPLPPLPLLLAGGLFLPLQSGVAIAQPCRAGLALPASPLLLVIL